MIYVTGDKHADIDYQSLSDRNFPEGKSLTKNDYVIIAGDFGLLFENEPTPTEEYLTKWYNDKPWTTLFIDGNHENFFRLANLEQVPMFEDVVGRVSDSIFHLRRGCIYKIDHQLIFTFGGATSIDKNYRIEGVSWWKEETPSYAEMELGLKALEGIISVDYIITHTCPLSVFNKLCELIGIISKTELDKNLQKYFELIKSNIQFKKWFFGHYHENLQIDNRFHVLYDQVIPISG